MAEFSRSLTQIAAHGRLQPLGMDATLHLAKSELEAALRVLEPVMLISEERELLVEIQDLLIDLFVQHDEPSRAEDWGRVRALEAEIDHATVRRDEICCLRSRVRKTE